MKSYAGWTLLAVLILCSLIAGMFKPAFGILGVGIALFITIPKHLCIITDPNRGLLFRFGKYVGILEPQWYLCFPGVEHVLHFTQEWIEVIVEAKQVFTQGPDPTYVSARAKVWVRPDAKRADVALTMPEDVMIPRVQTVGLNTLRRTIGGRGFDGLGQSGIEQEVLSRIAEECHKNGWETSDDFELEPIESKPETIRSDGRAHGDSIRAVADPLRGNSQAAFTNVSHAAIEAFERTFNAYLKNRFGSGGKVPEGGVHITPEQLTEISSYFQQRQS